MTSGAGLRTMGAKPSLSSMIPPHSSQLYLQTTCFHEHLIHSDLYISTSSKITLAHADVVIKKDYISVVLTRRHSYNNQSHTSLVLHERDWVFAWGDLIGWCLCWRLKSCVSATLQTRPPSSVDADAPCECSVSQSALTHMSHTGCVCALRSLGHGCVQEVKNDVNTVRFLTQTARFVS